MNSETADLIVDYAKRSCFEIIDITGGAPELNNNLVYLIQNLSTFAPRLMVRSNLSALNDGRRDHLFEFFKEHRVVIVASFPSLNESQTESQRGQGIFNMSIDALKKLNSLGYGQKETDLELNLVSNPSGAFLPSFQSQTEKRFREVMMLKWGVMFNSLFTFANVPLGRFRQWLFQSGNLDNYMEKLASSFNPCAVKDVMCRTMVSVSWNGSLTCPDHQNPKALLLYRTIVIPAPRGQDLHEVGP
jgi:radical SAM/Cys-rich protein